MRQETINIYTYEELSPKAQERARDWWRNGGLEYEWWEFVYDDARKVGECLGITISDIYFSGFGCQGNGAMFTGDWIFNPDWEKELKEYAPVDEELRRIGHALHYPNHSATIRSVGRSYYHSGGMDINVCDDGDQIELEVTRALRDFANWIYKQLESEYEYLISDEAVADTIVANEYEFLENGKRYVS